MPLLPQLRIMFAVPGWAVSADSLVSQRSGLGLTKESDFTDHDPPAEASKLKKRKRDFDEHFREARISSQDLDRLWKKHVGVAAGNGTAAGEVSSTMKEKRTNKTSKPHSREAAYGRTTEAVVKSAGTGPEAENDRNVLRRQPIHAGLNLPISPAKKRKSPAVPDSTEATPPMRRLSHRDASKPSAEKTHKHHPTIDKLPPPFPTILSTTSLTPLQAKMRHKLTSARFRHLNQTLYTSSSSDALALFDSSPDLFDEYHAGFSQQVKDSWPQNPVEQFVRDIMDRGKIQHNSSIDPRGAVILPLPRRKTGRCTIVDLGCGDAPLARGCQSKVKALNLKFHNFDLHASNGFVTKADIANLSLRDGEADVAVFCLSLMGTNWTSFVEEAWRALRGDGKGEVWVAEVKSRFGRVVRQVVKNSVGYKKKSKKPKMMSDGYEGNEKLEDEELFVEDGHGLDRDSDETDISAFVGVFQRRGFILRENTVNKSNKMFVSMTFAKSGVPTAGKHKGLKWTGREYERVRGDRGRMRFLDDEVDEEESAEEEAKVLKPCVYKTR